MKKELISLVEIFEDKRGEICRIVAQGLYSIEREKQLKIRAFSATMRAISAGKFTYRQEVYKHNSLTRNILQPKFKVELA